MTISKIEDSHSDFKGNISDQVYNTLEYMYGLIVGKYEEKSLPDSLELLKKILKGRDMHPADKKMKTAIYYLRWCSEIKRLIKEYENDVEGGKKSIDYYITTNSMQELSNLGFGWYYDVKFKKHKETLYSTEYGCDGNWLNWLGKRNVEHNAIKENGMQLIFKACKEHINRGGKIKLKSLSKCFGVDLFKYMQLDKNGYANLYIVKDAPINFIKINNKEMSLQEYLISDNTFDINSEPQFCVDVSNPRNEKAENYNNWSKKFLKDSKFISEKEFNEEKKYYDNINDEFRDYFTLIMLDKQRKKEGEKAISSRVSPIVDKEVIVSDCLWEIEEYSTYFNYDNIDTRKCYHFTFDFMEYCQLIFYYFKMYFERNSKNKFEEKYEIMMRRERDIIDETVLRIQKERDIKEQNNLENSATIQFHNEEMEKKYDYDKAIKLLNLYKEFLNSISIKEVSSKIKAVFSYIDWTKEAIPENWSIKNMYSIEDNIEKNLQINLYKCICKRAALN